jgi:hypothetical protein
VWIVHNKSTPCPYPTDLHYILICLHNLHIYIRYNVDRCRVYAQFSKSANPSVWMQHYSASVISPPPGLLLGSHPSLGLFTLSLSLSLSTNISIFPYPPSGYISYFRSLCGHLSVLSHPFLGCISNNPCVRVTLAAPRTHFNNILESRSCSSHPYTPNLWVTL